MGLKSIIKRIVRSNPWLGGWNDYLDGDPMAVSEEIFKEPVECRGLEELYNMLKSYDGVFKYKNLLFFNSSAYGIFVYDIRRPDDYIDHLTLDYMDYNRFADLVNKLVNKLSEK
jgi:hypothetical protein